MILKFTLCFLLACMGMLIGCERSGAQAPSAGTGGMGARESVTLIDNGKSEFSILLAPDAPRSVTTAAEELQHYAEKSTKAKLPIVTQAPVGNKPYISLGNTAASQAAGLSVGDIALEGFRIATVGGNVYILGQDTPAGQKTPLGGTSEGTANGVYTFLEDYFNIRWLLPGEMGEDVPELKAVAIPAVNRTDAPFFLNRRIPYIQKTRETVVDWSRRQRLGFSMYINHAHNWVPVVTPDLFKTHPEWFALVKGERLAPEGDRYKLETTNPELVQFIADAAIKAFRANPDLYMFSISPSDGSYNWSESVESKALHETDPHGKLSITPMILKFYNDVAKIVGKEFPDRKIAGYIYSNYLYPPKAGVPPMEPNLFIAIATSISYGYKMYRPAVQQEWDVLMKGWSAQTENTSYYDMLNWLRFNSASLTPPAPELMNFAFSKLVDYKVKGTYQYGTDEWSHGAINNYILARMSWNPRLDAHAVCNEFYRRAYGEAAGVHIQHLYEFMDAEVKAYYNRNQLASYTMTPQYVREVLGANYPKIEQFYLAAEKASGDASPNQKARLNYFRDNLILMQWRIRQLQNMPDATESPLYRSDAEVRKMIGSVHPGFGVVLGFTVDGSEKNDAREIERFRSEAGRNVPINNNTGVNVGNTAAGGIDARADD
jgi:hypothetical protein